MRRTRPTIVLATVAALALSGCRSDDDPPTDDRADEQVDADGETTDADGEDPEGVDGGAGDGDADAGDDGGEASPLGEVAIDQTESHPNGVEVTVQSLRVEQNAIFVDIEAFNGAPRTILLAGLDLAVVTDDTGKEYRYEPPEDNRPLRIEQNGTLEGAIAFIGRVGPDASSVTLRFNYSKQGEALQPADAQNADFSDAPSFEFTDLPLPGA